MFNAMEGSSNVGPNKGKLYEEDVMLKDTAYRAVVDHARTRDTEV